MTSVLTALPRGTRATDGPAGPAENATIVAREDVSATVARFVIRPDGPMLPFVAGQYVAVGLRVDERLVQRPYSSASHPRAAGAHEILVRRVPDGALTPSLWRVGVGARVRLGPPKGLFRLEPDDPRTHLLVASGTGIAPFVSMVRALADRAPMPRTVVVHGVSRAEDLAYRDLFETRAADGSIAYVPTVSRPDDPGSDGWTGRTGRTETALADLWTHLDPETTVAYLCGNPGMVATATRILRGVGLDDVRAESFWDTGAADPTGHVPTRAETALA
jgi:ferredoxin-NADP reductase